MSVSTFQNQRFQNLFDLLNASLSPEVRQDILKNDLVVRYYVDELGVARAEGFCNYIDPNLIIGKPSYISVGSDLVYRDWVWVRMLSNSSDDAQWEALVDVSYNYRPTIIINLEQPVFTLKLNETPYIPGITHKK